LVVANRDAIEDPLELKLERRERRLQFVRRNREKLVSEPERFLRLDKAKTLVLGPAPLGEIADHRRETDQTAALVMNGGHHAVGPEPRAVLASTPRLVLVASLARGDLEAASRLAGSDVVWGEEPRVMGTDDLRGRVPRDPLRARVPADHVPLRIEHDDG